ncbi:MAG: hypothetical protein MI739_09910 [Bacteroidales bacterium]|nr:hypothetical protein [Bacteroidales bacterium]
MKKFIAILSGVAFLVVMTVAVNAQEPKKRSCCSKKAKTEQCSKKKAKCDKTAKSECSKTKCSKKDKEKKK